MALTYGNFDTNALTYAGLPFEFPRLERLNGSSRLALTPALACASLPLGFPKPTNLGGYPTQRVPYTTSLQSNELLFSSIHPFTINIKSSTPTTSSLIKISLISSK